MKKLILIIGFILIGLLGFSQVTPVGVGRIADATTAFGKNVSIGNLVYNYGTDELFVCTAASVSTLTLTTGAANFTLLNEGLSGYLQWSDTTSSIATKYDIDTLAIAVALNTLKVGVTDGDKGDITVSASGATWTVDNDAITYAKIQNVVNDERILGRVSGADGIIEELTAAQVLTMINVAAGAQVNFTFTTEKFEETSGTPTAHSLAHTAQTGGAVVSLNGHVLDPANYTLTSSTITIGVPVLQYDIVTISYNY